MNHLQKLQSEFANSLFSVTKHSVNKQGQCPRYLNDAILHNGLDAQRRMNIYKNNLMIGLTNALLAVYPVINKLVGDTFFSYAAKEYIKRHPSESGDLHSFGEYFSMFLGGFSPAAKLVYLADMAKLEWAYHLAFHAGNETGIDMGALAKLTETQLSNIRLRLNNSAILIDSDFPLLQIWQANQEFSSKENVNLDEGGVKIIVNRNEFDIEFTPLRDGHYAFLQSLMNDQSFTLACESAVHVEQNINLSECLHRFISNNIIVDFTLL